MSCKSHHAVSPGPQVERLVVTILLLLSHLSPGFLSHRHRGCRVDTGTTALPWRIPSVAVMGVGTSCTGKTS